MSLGKVPMKVGGGAKQNVSLKQDVQISSATQREATTIMHCHTKKLNGDTFLHLHHDQKRGKKVGWANYHTKARFGT